MTAPKNQPYFAVTDPMQLYLFTPKAK